MSVCLVGILMSVTACSGEGDPSDTAVLYDIVCLEEDSETGSVFTLSKPGSHDIITLSAPQRLNTSAVPVGNRCLLMYVSDSGAAYQFGSITVRGYGTIVNGELSTIEEEEPVGWDRDPVYLLSAWISGRYLNIHARLPYDENPRDFALVMPGKQSDSRYPDIYLVHALNADVTTFSRAYYASFDISRLFDNNEVEGFTLHLNNSNLNLDKIRFDK